MNIPKECKRICNLCDKEVVVLFACHLLNDHLMDVNELLSKREHMLKKYFREVRA